MYILWYKKFYVTNNYKTQEQIQGISGTTHVECTSSFFPQKVGQKSVHYTQQNMVLALYLPGRASMSAGLRLLLAEPNYSNINSGACNCAISGIVWLLAEREGEQE